MAMRGWGWLACVSRSVCGEYLGPMHAQQQGTTRCLAYTMPLALAQGLCHPEFRGPLSAPFLPPFPPVFVTHPHHSRPSRGIPGAGPLSSLPGGVDTLLGPSRHCGNCNSLALQLPAHFVWCSPATSSWLLPAGSALTMAFLPLCHCLPFLLLPGLLVVLLLAVLLDLFHECSNFLRNE